MYVYCISINFYLSFVSRVDFARLLYWNKHAFIIQTKCIELREGKIYGARLLT
jgi:hypothetical protein